MEGSVLSFLSSIYVATNYHLRAIGPLRMLDRKWPEEALSGSHVTFSLNFVSVHFFPYFFSVLFFVLFSPVLFPLLFLPVLFLPVLFFPYFFFPYFFPRTFSKVATFEIQRFKISVSCFSSTCRYNTVHVPCGISIQTSPVGWGARMRDLKGPTINLFKGKEDWNIL